MTGAETGFEVGFEVVFEVTRVLRVGWSAFWGREVLGACNLSTRDLNLSGFATARRLRKARFFSGVARREDREKLRASGEPWVSRSSEEGLSQEDVVISIL